MKWPLYCIVFLSCVVFGQNRVEKTFSSQDISRVELIGNELFSIEINNSKSSEIILVSHSEGEYADAIVFQSFVDQNLLKIQTSIRSGFQIPNDKLSAHKVFSTQLTVSIPKNLRVRVESHASNINISGSFPFISALLYEGNCRFENFHGAAVIDSHNGSIYGKTTAATIRAHSKKGTVWLPKNLPPGNLLNLKTIQGDIEILQTKF